MFKKTFQEIKILQFITYTQPCIKVFLQIETKYKIKFSKFDTKREKSKSDCKPYRLATIETFHSKKIRQTLIR